MGSSGFWQTLPLDIYVSLYISLFGLPFTLGLARAWALVLRTDGSKWVIPATPDKPARNVHYFLLEVLE
jgi:hypothetical protein